MIVDEISCVLKNILNNSNINNNNNNWNIFIPKGYTTLEYQLDKLKKNKYNTYIFGIKGCDKIVSKNNIWKILINHYNRKYASTLMPNTFIYNKNDLELFTIDFNSSINPLYILKKNIQRKKGLKLTNNYYDIINSEKENYKIIQKYNKNLFLINKRKINLRIYFLIIDDNTTFKYYTSNLGKCIYTNKDFDKNDDFDFEKNITSFNLNLDIYNKNPKSLQDLQKYLGYKNSSILFKRIDKLFKDVSIAIDYHLKQSKIFNNILSFQLFGADVVFDNNLHPFLLEFNKGPDMKPKDNDDKIMKSNVFFDVFNKTKIINKLFYKNNFKLIYTN